MTILELGALGEFIGSIAVVITLIYLSMQKAKHQINGRDQKAHDLANLSSKIGSNH